MKKHQVALKRMEGKGVYSGWDMHEFIEGGAPGHFGSVQEGGPLSLTLRELVTPNHTGARQLFDQTYGENDKWNSNDLEHNHEFNNDEDFVNNANNSECIEDQSTFGDSDSAAEPE